MAKKRAAKKRTAKKASAKKPAAKKAGKKKPAARKSAKTTKRAAAAKRTTHRSKSGKKMYAKRSATGSFKDIQSYKRAHGQDVGRDSAAERAMGGMTQAETSPPAVTEASLNAPWTAPVTPGT